MDSRTKYYQYKCKNPDRIILVAADNIIGREIELRTFGEDMKKLYWVDGACVYDAGKGPGLKIKMYDLKTQREVEQIATDVWAIKV